MDTNFATYVTRINNTLEKSIAPYLQTDFQRQQVIAVINLLNQLNPRLEYRHDFLLEDIERLRGILKTVIRAFQEEDIPFPEDLLSVSKVDTGGLCGTPLKELHDELEVTVSRIIHLLYENKNQLKDLKTIEQSILEQITQGIMRDIMLFAPAKSLLDIENEKSDC